MIRCIKYHTCERNTLRGFCDLALTTIGLVIHDVCHHQKGDKEWVSLPAKSFTDAVGKVCWKPVLEFSPGAKQASASFQRQALRAIHDATATEQQPTSGQPRHMAPPI